MSGVSFYFTAKLEAEAHRRAGTIERDDNPAHVDSRLSTVGHTVTAATIVRASSAARTSVVGNAAPDRKLRVVSSIVLQGRTTTSEGDSSDDDAQGGDGKLLEHSCLSSHWERMSFSLSRTIPTFEDEGNTDCQKNIGGESSLSVLR
jgi:hypothetical protein